MISHRAINERVLRSPSQLQIWAARLRRMTEMNPDGRLRSVMDQDVRLPLWALSAAAALLLVSAGVYAFSNVFSRFAFYDDEGFVMISVQGFLNGHPLYDSVFTAYGPCYYFYQWIVHTAFCLPVTHDVIGALCVFNWLLAAAILGFAGYGMTRSPLIGFFVFIQAVFHLRGLANEPGHPQEIVGVLLAAATLVAVRGLRCPWTVVLLGGIGAALALTKINIGAFYGLALVLALACHSPFFMSRRALFWGILGLSGLLPFLLMRPHLAEEWARDYSVMACGAVLAMGGISYVFVGYRKVGPAQWFQAGLSFTSLTTALVTILLLKGTSLSAMIDCLVASPAKLAAGLCSPLRVQNSVLSGVAALAVAAIAVFVRTRSDRLHVAVSVSKGIYGLLGTLWFVDGAKEQLGYLLPWGWLLAVSSKNGSAPDLRDTFPRSFLGLLAVWEGLQAYPAAGTQAVLASFLLVLVCSICLYDAVTELAKKPWPARLLDGLSLRAAVLSKGLLLCGLLYLLAAKWCIPWLYWQDYSSLAPLELSGARLLRLPAQQVDTYRVLTQYLEVECDTFVTIPGFNSLYFWTGKTPPTYFNVAEVVMLTERQQAQVVAAFRRAKHPVIVLNERRLPFVLGSELTREGPLTRFIREECREVKRLNTFHILALRTNAAQSETASARPSL